MVLLNRQALRADANELLFLAFIRVASRLLFS